MNNPLPKTSDLCDACEGAFACSLFFTGIGKIRAFAGDIRTFRYQDGFKALRDLLNEPGAGHVLVIDGAGVATGALFGDVMAGMALRNGWEGIVVNGAIRDRAELDLMQIGVKALGTLPKRAAMAGSGERDVTVTFGGVSFVPGQRLVADDDGVIILPPGITEADIDIAGTVAATSVYIGVSSAPSR